MPAVCFGMHFLLPLVYKGRLNINTLTLTIISVSTQCTTTDIVWNNFVFTEQHNSVQELFQSQSTINCTGSSTSSTYRAIQLAEDWCSHSGRKPIPKSMIVTVQN